MGGRDAAGAHLTASCLLVAPGKPLVRAYSSGVLRGREQAAEAIAWVQACARASQGSALVLEGEAGSGKSWMLASAGEVPAVVLRVSGLPAEQQEPHAALQRLLAGVEVDLRTLPSAQREALDTALGRESGPPPPPLLLALAALSLLSSAAVPGGALVLVDDAHWVDEASLRVLASVARRLDGESIGVVFATRSHGRPEVLAGLPTVVLRDLDACDARELLAGVEFGVADALQRATGGNPLALVEAAATLSAEQRRGVAPLPDDLPATAASEAYGRRLAGLSDGAKALALLLALGAAEPTSVLQAAASGSGLTGRHQDELEHCGLLDRNGRWVHPLAQAAAVAAATAAARRTASAVLASAVLASGGPTVRALPYRLAALSGPDDGLADALATAAAGAAAAGDHDLARRTWEAAADTGRVHQGERFAQAALAAVRAGRLDVAFGLHDRALEYELPAALAATVWLSRGRTGHVAGSPSAALDDFDQAASSSLLLGDEALAVRAMAEGLFSAMYAGDPRRARAFADRARALSPPDPMSRFLVAHLEGAAARLAGAPQIGGPLLERAVDEAVAAELVHEDASTALWLVSAALLAGRPLKGAAAVQVRAALDRWRRTGDATWLPRVVRLWGLTEQLAGRWMTCWAAVEESVDLARGAGQRTQLAESLGARAELYAWRGERQSCLADLRERDEVLRHIDVPWLSADSWWVRGVLLLGLGDPAGAAAALAPAGTLDGGLRFRGAALADLVEALVLCGRHEQAQQVVDATDPSDADPAVVRARGVVQQDDAIALDLLAQAVTDVPIEGARARLLLGERLRRAGRRVEAREHLRVAVEQFEAASASPWAERATSELAATGASLRRRDAVEQALTGAESRVALLVAEGRTTRDVAALLFLSPKTVEFHLSRVYRKVGVRGRAELAARLAGRVTVEAGPPT